MQNSTRQTTLVAVERLTKLAGSFAQLVAFDSARGSDLSLAAASSHIAFLMASLQAGTMLVRTARHDGRIDRLRDVHNPRTSSRLVKPRWDLACVVSPSLLSTTLAGP